MGLIMQVCLDVEFMDIVSIVLISRKNDVDDCRDVLICSFAHSG